MSARVQERTTQHARAVVASIPSRTNSQHRQPQAQRSTSARAICGRPHTSLAELNRSSRSDMTKAESPTQRHHLRRLASMSGSTRDVPDASVSVLTRARRRAIESSSEDDRSSDGLDAPATPLPAYAKIVSSRRSASAHSNSSDSPDPIDSLHSSPTRRAATTERPSPTKGTNPFTTNSASRSRTMTSTSTSPTRPADVIAARLAAARPTEPRTSAFSTMEQTSDHDRDRRTTEAPRSTSSRASRSPTKEITVSRSPAKTTTSSEPKVEGVTRRKSLRSRNASDENQNPFGPTPTSTREPEVKNDKDHVSERAQRLTRRRSIRGLDTADDSASEKEEQTPVTPASARISAALARRRQEPIEKTPVEKASSRTYQEPVLRTPIQPAEEDAAEKERKEKERQERLARRRSLYSYLPPKRAEIDADAQEVDALLKTGTDDPKTPPKTSVFSLPTDASLPRSSNPFVRRPRTSSGVDNNTNKANSEVEQNINEVKGSFQRMSLESEQKRSDYTPVRSSRPPITTPGVHQRKDRPHSSSLAAAVATVARSSRVPLRACTILVDVRDMDGEDVSAPWIEKLKDAGARVYSRWPGEKTVLTHVVWKAGRPSTLNTLRALEKEVERKFEEGGGGGALGVLTPGDSASSGTGLTRRRSLKAIGSAKTMSLEDQGENLSMPVIVGVGWAQACVSERRHVEEEPFLVEIGKEAIFNRRRRLSMAPRPVTPSTPGPQTPKQTPTLNRGRKSLASSSLRSEIENAKRQSLLYAPVVSSPLRKRCFIDADAFTTTPVSKYSSLTSAIATGAVSTRTELTPTPSRTRYVDVESAVPTGRKWVAETVERPLGAAQWEDGVVAMDLD